MIVNTQQIYLELTNKIQTPPPVITVKQGDSASRSVNIVICDNGAIRDDISTESAELYFAGNPPTYIVETVTDGVCSFTVPQSAILKSGTIMAELRLKDPEDTEYLLSTMSFIVDVVPAVYDVDAIIGSNDGDALLKATSDAIAAAEEATQAILDVAKLDYDVDGDRIGVKIGDETEYTYTDHLTGPAVLGVPVTITSLSGSSLIAHNLIAIDYGTYGVVTGNIMFKTASDVAIGGNTVIGTIAEGYRPNVIEGSGYTAPILAFSGFDPSNKVFTFKISSGVLTVYPITAAITADTMCWANVNYRYK